MQFINFSIKKFFPNFQTNIRYRINTSDLLVNEVTGELRARRSFDREIEPTIGFTIYADGEWATTAQSGTLIIRDQNDNSPQFELGTVAKFTIDFYRTGIGAELFRLQCTDQDDGLNAKISYSINSSYFEIDRETGIVRLAKFPEGTDQLQFHVTAMDNGEEPRHSTIKVVVQVEEPDPVRISAGFLAYA